MHDKTPSSAQLSELGCHFCWFAFAQFRELWQSVPFQAHEIDESV